MARQRETAGSREGHGTPDRVGFTPDFAVRLALRHYFPPDT